MLPPCPRAMPSVISSVPSACITPPLDTSSTLPGCSTTDPEVSSLVALFSPPSTDIEIEPPLMNCVLASPVVETGPTGGSALLTHWPAALTVAPGPIVMFCGVSPPDTPDGLRIDSEILPPGAIRSPSTVIGALTLVENAIEPPGCTRNRFP